MAQVTATEVITYLSGYGVTTLEIPEAVLDEHIALDIEPMIAEIVGPLGSVLQRKAYPGGGGTSILLPFKKIVSVDSIVYNRFNGPTLPECEVDTNSGIVYSTSGGNFPSDAGMVVTFTVGHATVPDEIKLAIKMAAAIFALEYIADETGGGPSMTTDGHTDNYGENGMYTTIIKRLTYRTRLILSRYNPSV